MGEKGNNGFDGQIIGTLKMEKRFWDMITTGKKQYEFRKLEKGITTGAYAVTNLEETIVYGDIYIRPIGINPIIETCKGDCGEDHWDKDLCYLHSLSTYWIEDEETGYEKPRPFYCFLINIDSDYEIDKDTYNFIKENYKGKHDFVVYEISGWSINREEKEGK